MTVEQDLDVDHLTWLVESRAETQRVSLKLLDLIRQLRKAPSLGSSVDAQKLVGVAFSLWRAAFLSDQDASQGLVQADFFLEKLIVDNAINYPQDRNARDWSWGFYMTTAHSFLNEVEKSWPGILGGSAKSQEPRDRWDYLQKAYSKAVDRLDADIKKNSKRLLSKP